MKRLLFFDIDGTIMRSKGVGRQAVEDALAALFDRSFHSQHIPFGGKTDPQILREVLEANGVAATPENLQKAGKAYMTTMRTYLPQTTIQLMPNIHPLVKRLAGHEQVTLSLLTGNYEPMAYFKLAQVGLDHHFAHGAFGSDHEDRNALPKIGLARVASETGLQFARMHTFVIGDTPRDIECARAAGIKVVAVATGEHSLDQLAVHEPDLLLADLRDTEGFLSFILD